MAGTINDNIAKLYELVQAAKRGDVHRALGFPSWTTYLADLSTVQVRLEPQQTMWPTPMEIPSPDS